MTQRFYATATNAGQARLPSLRSGVSGQAVLISVILISLVFLIIVSGFSSVVLKEAKISRNLIDSKKSYFLSEAGVEDVAYRIINKKLYGNEEVLNLDGFFATTTTTSVSGTEKEISSLSNFMSAARKVKSILSTDIGISFSYGVQVGAGGLDMDNTSSVEGNVYSNGQIDGENKNEVNGDIVSAGPSGLINNVHTTGSAYAHTISGSQIGKNAYYQHISDTTVTGISFPESTDQEANSLPITDSMISEWETGAAAGGTISSPCPSGAYTIDSSTTLGPIKIDCNLKIKGDPTITLLGNVWVVGSIEMENTAIIKLDPSLSGQSVVIIADKPTNRSESSDITLQNSVQFQDSGTGGYILLVSQNNSAETGGDEEAIEIKNSVSGQLLLYAGHGEIQMENSANLREVTGYKIHLKNSAKVVYETGLADLLFESGPSGGYSISSWKEVSQ